MNEAPQPGTLHWNRAIIDHADPSSTRPPSTPTSTPNDDFLAEAAPARGARCRPRTESNEPGYDDDDDIGVLYHTSSTSSQTESNEPGYDDIGVLYHTSSTPSQTESNEPGYDDIGVIYHTSSTSSQTESNEPGYDDDDEDDIGVLYHISSTPLSLQLRRLTSV